MPEILETYPYVDGATLDVDGHNSNLDAPSTAGAGILSELCGGIDANNFDPSFSVQSYHLSPGCMVWTATREATITRDYFGDIFSGTASYQYFTVDAVRFRVPFNAGWAIVSASAFISPVLWAIGGLSPELYHGARTALFVNQIKDVESEFAIAHNANVGIVGSSNFLRKLVGRYAVPRTHFKLITDASQLMAGTFEVGLKLAINSETELSASYERYPTAGDLINRKLYPRITIGNVSINAVFFKNTNS